MKLFLVFLLNFFGVIFGKECGLSTSKLICYYSKIEDVNGCLCTHIVVPVDADLKGLKEKLIGGVKVFVAVNEFNEGLINLLKINKVDGLELNLKKLDSKNDLIDLISTIKTKLGSNLEILLSVPAKAELLAKFYDFKALSKHVEMFILQTSFLGASNNNNVTFHPSRLSGIWDIQNTDSVVDLVNGLGAPLSKVILTAPVQAYQFKLQNEELTAPGSPALEIKSITRNDLCSLLTISKKNWTLERDEDQAGPYIFNKNVWIAFDDAKSIDIKVKYSRIRGLAGIALKDLTQDGGSKCDEYTLLESTYNGLTKQARTPRGAVLHSLEREIVDNSGNSLASIQTSPFRITRIVDTGGKIHVVRQDSRTEFQCSRQGYFVHPRSCNRFYRCVKFNQLSEDYNVFEFDCPAGLAFDERVEVCVWPGSLPHGTPCSGSSEIAPVPRSRFQCPSEPGYYPDPENCRWFYACLDHGESASLLAYEFRCPYGLVFDGEKLVCEWSWLVPKCANAAGLNNGINSDYYYGNVDSSHHGLNYDGFGALGAIQLGGIHGMIERPISTIYSNAGANTFKGNAAGYIYQDGKNFEYNNNHKTSQALQNAGLLRVNNGIGYQVIDNKEIYPINDGHENGAYVDFGVAGKINIIGGGHSAVGSLHGINAGSYNNNNNRNGAVSVIGSVPTVTAVPVPGIKTATNFDTFNGGVIANYPELQMKFNSYADAIRNNNAKNFSSSFVNFVDTASTPSSITYEQNNKYNSRTDGILVSSPRPFAHSASSASEIFLSSTTEKPEISSVGINLAHQYETTGGYNYDKPLVKFEEKPHQNVVIENYQSISIPSPSSTPSSVIIQEHQPHQVLISSTSPAPVQSFTQSEIKLQQPAYLVNQYYYQKSQPPVVGSSVYQQTHIFPTNAPISQTPSSSVESRQYNYQNVLLQAAKVPLQQISYPQSNLQTSYKYADVNNYQDQQEIVQNVGYQYPKPEIKFEESPQVVSAAPKPVQQIYSTSYLNQDSVNAINKGQNVQQDLNPGYYYQKPASVQYVETSVTTQKPVEISITHQYDGQISHQDNNAVNANVDGYSYPKPELQLIQTSGIYPTTQSDGDANKVPVTSTVSSQLYNIDTSKVNYGSTAASVNNENSGYIYAKPAIQFVETPIRYSSTPKPPIKVSSNQAIVSSYYNQANQNSASYNSGGYSYSNPKVQIIQTPARIQQSVEFSTPASVSSYFNIGAGSKENAENAYSAGYSYPRPEIKFETTPPSVVYNTTPRPSLGKVAANHQTIVSSYYNEANQNSASYNNGGYSYINPKIQIIETPAVAPSETPVQSAKPAVVSSYFNLDTNFQKNQQNSGNYAYNGEYSYQKPEIKFEATPAISTTTENPIQVTSPAVATSYFNYAGNSQQANKEQNAQNYAYNTGYNYQKPEVKFEETPVVYSTQKPTQSAASPAVVSSYYNTVSNSQQANKQENTQNYAYNAGYNYQKPELKFEETPVIYSTQKPIQQHHPTSPAIVTPYYFNIASNSHLANKEDDSQNYAYTYKKPEIKFEEASVIHSTEKPVQPAPPAVVTSYFNIASKSQKANTEENAQNYAYNNAGHNFQKPELKIEEAPVIYSTQEPIQHAVNPAAVVTSYFNIANKKANEQNSQQEYAYNVNYNHLQPQIKFEESPTYSSTPKPQEVQTSPAVVSTFDGNYGSRINGYSYDKPSINRFEETPQIYSTPKSVEISSVTPAIVSSYFNFDTSSSGAKTQSNIENLNFEYNKYQQPSVQYESTPKPSGVPAVVTSYFNIQTAKLEQGSQKNNIDTVDYITYRTPKLKEVPHTTFKPTPASVTSYFNQGGFRVNSAVNYETTPRTAVLNYIPQKYDKTPVVAVTTSYGKKSKGYQYPVPSIPFREEPDDDKLVKEEPFVKNTAYVTTDEQISRVPQFGDVIVENYQIPNYNKIKQQIAVTGYTVKPTLLDTVNIIAKKPTTPRVSYYQTTFSPKVTIQPTRQYIPVSSTTFRVPTSPEISSEYLPSTTITPSREYLPVRKVGLFSSTTVEPKITTFHREYLPVRISTKVPSSTPSNEYLPVRKYTSTTTTEVPIITTLNREYLPVRNKVKIIPTRASSLIPSLNKSSRIRTVVKTSDAHPLLSAKLGAQCTCISDKLTLRRKQKVIIVDEGEDEGDEENYYQEDNKSENVNYEAQKVSDQEIVKAVRTGLKLVKEAAKEGAKEGTQEVLEKTNRLQSSRNDLLRASVDCQRAGLFRHPTQCNKFYSCRWDCTKKRFTLHVLNCPVHLTFDNNLGACNWPSQGPACVENTLISGD